MREVDPRDLEGFDAVIHLAALSNDPLGNLDPEITYEINHRGSVRMAKAAKDAGVSRFLFASSCSNYGQSGEDIIDETGELNPVTAYGWSKVLSERDISRAGGHQLLARPISARPPPTACRRGCASTSCSTTWSPGR